MFHGTGPHLSVEGDAQGPWWSSLFQPLNLTAAEKVFHDIAGRSEVIHLADGIAVRITLSGEL